MAEVAFVASATFSGDHQNDLVTTRLCMMEKAAQAVMGLMLGQAVQIDTPVYGFHTPNQLLSITVFQLMQGRRLGCGRGRQGRSDGGFRIAFSLA